ncbi:MAG: spore maturation protein [Oscillospiraceae bacterium]|nr:spore maturation protein [Oscillospiraceae bacterium]
MNIADFAVPTIFTFVIIFALCKKVDVFGEFTAGVKEGLQTVLDVFPALFALVLSVGMFRASGGAAMLSGAIAPLTDLIGFPREAIPLMLLRPLSGSGATAVYEGILSDVGPDSFAGRVSSVMLGSSETTFYVIAMYFSATKVKKTRHTLPSALSGDVLICVLSGFIVGLLFKA